MSCNNLEEEMNGLDDNCKYYDYLIVGAGLSGAVIAERIASVMNKKVLVIDKRDHIGGNCYDFVDENNILMNKYGAHIFHTNYENVWEYINRFSKWVRWDHKVLSYVDKKYVPIPVNINTVNMLCNENLKNEDEMSVWLDNNQVKYNEIVNSEQMGKSRVGCMLYDKMFKPYTIKQWNKNPDELSPSVLARIPVRNNFDDRYFNDKYQALPENGYTSFITNILNHPNITVMLNIDYFDWVQNNCNTRENKSKDGYVWQELIYTGPIDSYFPDTYEKLEYRSINFVIERFKNMNYYQPVSVVNYPETNVDYTRIVEYKHFLNQNTPHTTIVREYTTDIGEPYYPVPNAKNLALYEKYRGMTDGITGVHFIGRLANYKYFNMDEAINNALIYFNTKLQKKWIND